MRGFLEENFSVILTVTLVLLLVILGICLVAKLFKVAVGILILALVVPYLFMVFWGDGETVVSRFASIFEDKYQQQIEEAYQFYKEKDAEDPFVDYDAASDVVTDVFNDVAQKGEAFFRDALSNHPSLGDSAKAEG